MCCDMVAAVKYQSEMLKLRLQKELTFQRCKSGQEEEMKTQTVHKMQCWCKELNNRLLVSFVFALRDFKFLVRAECILAC